ncbi:hypothetical protein Tco_0725472 [Tanacetum coccineum]|uniref:Uncharacterized protein n=1 Tax=Tanacetum coccineum TaxID=301880 RepID=A0ABQ4YDU2_9ASTR
MKRIFKSSGTIKEAKTTKPSTEWKGQSQVNEMSADVARGHGDDGGGDDHPPPHQIPTGCGGCLGNRGKGSQKPNFGGRRAGRMHTRQETRNLELKSITDKNGPVQSTQFDMRPHMESDRWPQIYAAIQQHLQKIYNGMKDTLKERYWIPDSDGTYDLERIRQTRPSHISEVDWDAQIAFWNDPKNLAWATQNKQNRAKSKVMESSTTREYLSLIHTFFLTHTVGDVFLNLADKALYDEMLRLQGLGSNTPSGVPYTEDEIMAIVHGGNLSTGGGQRIIEESGESPGMEGKDREKMMREIRWGWEKRGGAVWVLWECTSLSVRVEGVIFVVGGWLLLAEDGEGYGRGQCRVTTGTRGGEGDERKKKRKEEEGIRDRERKKERRTRERKREERIREVGGEGRAKVETGITFMLGMESIVLKRGREIKGRKGRKKRCGKEDDGLEDYRGDERVAGAGRMSQEEHDEDGGEAVEG